jgi:Holliday junction resolvase RusA-like endonuclease
VSDTSDALDFYTFLAHPEPDGTEHAIVCVIPGTPPSKARVRFGKGHTYNRPEAVAAEKRTAVYVQQALRGYRYEGNVALGCIFYRPTFQRVDADNMLKHVCDSINGLAFKDDSQVTAIAARVELDPENPRTVLVLGAHQSTMRRGINDSTPCQVCGKPIPSVSNRGHREPQRYCSRECLLEARAVDLSTPVPCAHCSQPFRRRTSAQIMCSKECRVESLRDKRKAAAAPRSRCQDCDKQLSHTRGGRCRDCWRTAPKAGAA